MLALFGTVAAVRGEVTKSPPTEVLVQQYLGVQKALVADDLLATQASARGLYRALGTAPELFKTLEPASHDLLKATDLETARTRFAGVSGSLIDLIDRSPVSEGAAGLFVAHCPMAMGGQGASWIQSDREIRNPYYGARMLRCGGIERQLGDEPGAGAATLRSDKHQHGEESHVQSDRNGAVGSHVDTTSTAALMAIHANVPEYFAKSAPSSENQDSAAPKSASSCGMACCANPD